MINSILNCHKDLVRFDNIKLNNDIITEPNEIKSHIQEHFDQWTATRHIDEHIYNCTWLSEYNPKTNIDTKWYQPALQEFTTEEVSQTLSQLPNNKACGPSGISYEMLKQARPTFIQTITTLFNRCLTTNQIPKQ